MPATATLTGDGIPSALGGIVPADPICIITATGLQCEASPLKTHVPGSEQCAVTGLNGGSGEEVAAIARFLMQMFPRRFDERLPLAKAKTIARVTYLMVTADAFNVNLPFTIVRSRGPGLTRVQPLSIPALLRRSSARRPVKGAASKRRVRASK